MVSNAREKLCLATLIAHLAFPSFGASLPAAISNFAHQMQSTLNAMVASDPSILKQIGETPATLAQSQLAYNRAFPMYRVDAATAVEAKEMSELVRATGVYAIPYCVGGKCPLVASFAVDPTSGQAQFVSVGRPNFAHRNQDAEVRVKQDPELTGERRVVEFPEGSATFSLMNRVDTGEAVLVPSTPQEARALLAMVRNPDELERTRTRRGNYTFRREHVGEVVAYLKENAPPPFEPSAQHLQGEAHKPYNSGPAGHHPHRDSRGAVLDITTPIAPPSPAPRAANIPAPISPATPTLQTATTRIPSYLLLPVIACSLFFGLLAWLFRKVKSAV